MVTYGEATHREYFAFRSNLKTAVMYLYLKEIEKQPDNSDDALLMKDAIRGLINSDNFTYEGLEGEVFECVSRERPPMVIADALFIQSTFVGGVEKILTYLMERYTQIKEPENKWETAIIEPDDIKPLVNAVFKAIHDSDYRESLINCDGNNLDTSLVQEVFERLKRTKFI